MPNSEPRDPRTQLAAMLDVARRVIDSARIVADDGTVIYAPDGSGYYRGIWTRDFCYLAEGAGDLLPDRDVLAGFEYLVRHQRADGGMPGMATPAGVPYYLTVGDAAVHTDADNSPFMVKLAEECRRRTGSLRVFEHHLDALARGMTFVPRSPDGLVWIDPEHPHTGYGFRDVMDLRGADSFCSLLYWEAAGILARAAGELRRQDLADRFAAEARAIEESLARLLDPDAGLLLAGSVTERHVDVWANAYFVHIGVPLPELRRRILRFLVDSREEFMQDGQVRHLRKGESWDRVKIYTIPEGIYQNGAYWATASGWVLSAFTEENFELAWATAQALVSDLVGRGVFECVNRGFLWGGHGVEYTKVRNYVASVANPLPRLREIYARSIGPAA